MRKIEKNLPKKLYYTLGEASQFLEVKPYVLRYWDKEFKVRKKGRKRRPSQKYHRGELEKFLRIKGYLYDELYSLAGAKKKIAQGNRNEKEGGDSDYKSLLLRVRRGLKFIEGMLSPAK